MKVLNETHCQCKLKNVINNNNTRNITFNQYLRITLTQLVIFLDSEVAENTSEVYPSELEKWFKYQFTREI